MLNQIIGYSLLSGSAIFLGGIIAYFFEREIKEGVVKQGIIHTLIAFGGGIMLSALALVLVPRGMEELNLLPFCLAFAGGAITFFALDRYLAQKGGKMATLLAMLMDYIPESIALGATFALDPPTAILLAIFIGLQNLPEAFNSYREMVQSDFKPRKILTIFFFLSFMGVVSALAGHFLLHDKPEMTGLLMTFASGGILYLLFQDIVPDSKLKNTWYPSLGATLGFLVGVIAEKLI